MKKWSRVISLILVLLMVFGMVGCRGKKQNEPSGTEPSINQDPTEPTIDPSATEPTVEEPTENPYDVEIGQVFKVIQLATKNNGENGVTYYYTEDGVNLTPFDQWNDADGKWVHGDKGVLFYPALVPQDNYTAAGTSSTEYVAVSYEIPETGAVELFSWTALQGGEGEHGYRVKIAQGSPENVLYTYDVVGASQTIVHNTYGMKVTKGEKMYLVFEPLVKEDKAQRIPMLTTMVTRLSTPTPK